MTADDKSKLNGITAGAEPNQNAFANVTVGSTNIQADAKSDTLTLVAGSNVTLTPDATNDKVTIAATDTTYSDATTSAAGLMSAADKTKLNGVESEANYGFNSTSDGTNTGDASDSSGKLTIAGKAASPISVELTGLLNYFEIDIADATTGARGADRHADRAHRRVQRLRDEHHRHGLHPAAAEQRHLRPQPRGAVGGYRDVRRLRGWRWNRSRRWSTRCSWR